MLHWKWIDIGGVMQLQSYVNIWNGFGIVHTECTETEHTNMHSRPLIWQSYCTAFHYTLHIAYCIVPLNYHSKNIQHAHSHIQIVAFAQWHKSSLRNWFDCGWWRLCGVHEANCTSTYTHTSTVKGKPMLNMCVQCACINYEIVVDIFDINLWSTKSNFSSLSINDRTNTHTEVSCHMLSTGYACFCSRFSILFPPSLHQNNSCSQ